MRLSFKVWRDGNRSTVKDECTLLKFQGGKNLPQTTTAPTKPTTTALTTNPKSTVTTTSTVPNSFTTSSSTIQTTVTVEQNSTTTLSTSTDSISLTSSTSTSLSSVKTTESTNQVIHFSTHNWISTSYLLAGFLEMDLTSFISTVVLSIWHNSQKVACSDFLTLDREIHNSKLNILCRGLFARQSLHLRERYKRLKHSVSPVMLKI